MSLIGHITVYEISFVAAVYLVGVASGLALGWRLWASLARKREKES